MMLNINLEDFELKAKNKLPKDVFEYYAGGAGDELSLRMNRQAFEQISLLPAVLKDTRHCDTRLELLGLKLASPIIGAPMAFQELADIAGEIGVAQALAEAELANILSTMATTSLEEVISSSQCPSWFQVYLYQDRAISLELINRAINAGYQGIVLTVDVPLMGKRERDIRNQFSLPAHISAKNFSEVLLTDLSYKTAGSTIKSYTDKQFDRSLTWQDVSWLKGQLSVPLILKGIMRSNDASKAIGQGVDAIIVSNHGGRQLDGVPASIELLADIAAAVNGKIPVLLDGGVRRGTDILKALGLGADCVLVGRPLLWGLAVNGKAGVTTVLEILKQEFWEAMILCGYKNLKELREDKGLIKWNRK